MRLSARRFRGSLFVLALTFGSAAVAQELQLDPKALDTSGAASSSSVQTKRGKGRKGNAGTEAVGQQPAQGKPAAGGPNRQFGELEGWSPGKAPPKPKDQPDSTPAGSKVPVNVTPSGNMGAGFAF
ncbi:hypothetical protein [Methylocystis parvus]|uniref:Uncharacterized protein n=1 Tax=Methylocystis parvus TaxID=134 RepID=A0A6B8M838_9HYPH|nr:hypothetical protein [Methylocystis parvus]QGM98575.1 hypothetical protein F7D14_14545 [Methylocystis parvus]WBK01083.1 hypothetical protein MMG94_05025 [Methylocystis parvus OBBP]